MGQYWFRLDTDIVKGNTRTLSLTFAEASGAPVPILAWTFYYKAVKVDDSAVTITVANAAMTRSDSGMGVTDTITIPLDNSVSAVAAGRYNQEIAVAIGGEPTTIAMGTLNVVERVLTVA